jgi:acetyltransferase-like isoleucine patch superfamily enzyme
MMLMIRRTVWPAAVLLCLATFVFSSKALACNSGSVAVTSPAAGATITSGPVTITGTYTCAYNVQIGFNAGLLYNVQMTPTAQDTGNWSYTWNPAGYSGNVEITARGFDSSTRYFDWAPYVNVTVNIPQYTPPVVSIVSPADGSTANGTSQPVTVSASAVNGLASVQVRIDWGAWQNATLSGGNYVYNWNTSGLGNVTHCVEAQATDNNGNVTKTATNYVKTGTGTNQPPTNTQVERSMWLWEPAAYQLVESAGAESVLGQFMNSSSVSTHLRKTIYFYADQYDGGYDLVNNPAGYRNFIAWAHSQGYKVFALLASGFYLAPEYSYDRYQSKAVALVENVLNYNISSAANQQFDGINTDFEPHGLPDWTNSKISPTVPQQWLDNMNAMMKRKAASGQNLNIGPAMPRQFISDNICSSVNWNGTTEACYQHAQDITDYVTEMDYRTIATGTDSIVYWGQDCVNYATQIGKHCMLGVETTDINASGDPAKISFYTNGETYMENTLATVFSNFASSAGFLGMAIHHYDAYRILPTVQNSSGTVWQPTLSDTTPPTTPTNVTATTFNFQEIDLHWSRSTDGNLVDHYEVHRSTSSGFTPSAANLAWTTEFNFIQDWGLLPSTTYYYVIIAVDQSGNASTPSSQSSATTAASAGLLPMHIQSISISFGRSTATGTITMADGSNNPLGSINVMGNWDGAAGKKFDGNTGSNGQYSTSSETLTYPVTVTFTPVKIVDGAVKYYWAYSQDVVHTATTSN